MFDFCPSSNSKAMKTVAMRTPPGAAKWLVEGQTLPLLQRAMQFAVHEEMLVRTSARTACLLLFTTLKQQEELHIALAMVEESLLGSWKGIFG